MPWELNDIEVRVLGVLIEKSLTQPNAYPMTINAIRAGANQLQNRDPVMELQDGDVSRALQSLQHKQLAAQAPPNPGDRSNKFRHRVVETLRWDPREQAIMAELMLRGRQTAGELRTRASRMVPLQDLESLVAILESLKQGETPFVAELPREPGKSANRFRHLMSGEDRETMPAAGTPTSAQAPLSAAALPATSDVSERLATLEARVAYLMRTVADLQKQVSRPVDTAAVDNL